MKYKYIGNGAGVPGLPHEVSDEEAKEAGVEELLKQAIKDGVYAPLSASQTSPRFQKTKTGGEELNKE